MSCIFRQLKNLHIHSLLANYLTYTMFTIQINCCWNKSAYAVCGRTPDGEGHWDEPLFECNARKELIKWLNASWSEKRKAK